MAKTKVGKALILTLGAISPKLAQDSALPALVGELKKKDINAGLRTKLYALDAESKDKIDTVMDAMEDDDIDPAMDEDETEEEKKKRLAADEDDDEEKKSKEKKAMDARIATAVDIATKSATKRVLEADQARRDVRSVVGEVITQDSAADIYIFALDEMKVPHEGVTEVAGLKAIFTAANTVVAPKAVIAQDAAGFAKMFPGATRFGSR